MEMRLEKKALDKIFRRRDRLDLNPDFQRTPVWSDERQQKFLDTILKRWNVPKVYFRVIDEEHFECIDGQQRLIAIFRFYSDDLHLSKKFSDQYGGMYYKDLPDKIKDIFDDYELQIEEIRNATDEEVEDLFQRLQLGMPLNSGEKLNAISGDIRDFAKRLSEHEFLTKKISISIARNALLNIVAQICLLEIKGISNAKFVDLKDLFERYKTFNKEGKIAKKIIKVLNYLNLSFDEKYSELKNRASVVSIYLLISKLIEKSSLKGKEKIIRDFYIEFLKKLKFQVEKGAFADDPELLSYQSAVNQAADSKDSIQKRHRILLKRLIEYDPDLEQFVDRTELRRLASLERLQQIRKIKDGVINLIAECNKIFSTKYGKDLFKITSEVFKNAQNLDNPIKSKDDFGNFIDALYKMIYEGSGSLKRIPQSFKEDDDFIGFEIKHLRTDLRHDYEHGKEKDIEKKKKIISEIYKKYTGKATVSSLRESSFNKIQESLLENILLFLKDLKNSLD